MKNQLIILFIFLPVFAQAQFDFDSRYFTINSSSLSEAPTIKQTVNLNKLSDESAAAFTLDRTPTLKATLSSFRIDASNYWQPVDMMGAVNVVENYIETTLDIAPLNSEYYGSSRYTADGSTKVKNIVYKEVRGLDLLDPCPPIGICPRCAPYRTARGY